MEIDFLGLNSPKFDIEEESSKDAFSHTTIRGAVETSLCLNTSSSLDDCKREILDFCEKKKTWEFPSDKMIPSSSCSSSNTHCILAHYNQENSPSTQQPNLVLVPRPVFQPSPTAGLLFDLNENSSNLRNISEIIPAESASLGMLYSGRANVFNDTLPAEKTVYMAGKASTGLSDRAGICTSGYTPTVAMARRATLARFLEKRFHRMNQARTSHLMGKSLNAINSEACDRTITRSNTKVNQSLRRS